MLSINLSSPQGNAFFIMGMTKRELRKAGVSKEEIDEYYEEATSSDYDNLLDVTKRYIEQAGVDFITI